MAEEEIKIEDIESYDQMLEEYPDIVKSYDSPEELAMLVFQEKQINAYDNNAGGRLNIFDFFDTFLPINKYTDLKKYRESYTGTAPLPTDNLELSNIMYQDLRKEITKANNELYKYSGSTFKEDLSTLPLNLLDYANAVHPLERNETLVRRSMGFDLERFNKSLNRYTGEKRYNYDDIAKVFGIDYARNDILDAEIEKAIGFGNTKEDKRAMSQSVLMKHYGDILGRKITPEELGYTYDDNLNLDVFTDPITKKQRYVDNPSRDGISKLYGPSIAMAFDFIGMVAIGGPTSSIIRKLFQKAVQKLDSLFARTTVDAVSGVAKTAAYSTGSGVGYDLGMLTKDAIREMYLNPDLTREEFGDIFFPIFNERILKPAIDSIPFVGDGSTEFAFDQDAAEFTAIFDALFRLGRGVGSLLRGNKVGKEEFKYLTKNIKDSDEVAKYLNKMVKEQRKKYENLELPENPDLIFTVANSARRSDFKWRQEQLANSTKFGDKFEDRLFQNMTALRDMFQLEMMAASKKNIEDALRVIKEGGDFADTTVGKNIIDIVEAWKNPQTRKQLDKVFKNAEEMEQIYGKGPLKDIIAETEIRGPLELILDSFDANVRRMYQKIDKISQINKVGKIPTNNYEKAIRSLDKRDRDSLIKNSVNAASFVKDILPKEISFKVLRNTRSDLLRMQRQGKFDDLPEGVGEKLIKALDDDIAAWGKTDKARALVADEFKRASDFYREGKSEFYNVLKEVLEKDAAGNYKIAGAEVFPTVFKPKGTAGYIKKVKDVKLLFRNRDFKNAFLKDLKDFYRREVIGDVQKTTKTGVVDFKTIDPKKHTAFMDKYGEQIKVLFPEEHAKLTNVKNSLKTFDDSIADYNKFIDKLKQKSGGRILDLNPENIVDELFNFENKQVLLDVTKIVREADKEAFGDIQAAILRKIYRETTLKNPINGVDIFNPYKFNDLMSNKNFEILRTVFDEKQIKFLDKFNKALAIELGQVASREQLEKIGPDLITQGLVRTFYARPLSRPGIFFTNFLARFDEYHQKRLGTLMLEPNADKAISEIERLFRTGKTFEAEQLMLDFLKLPRNYLLLKEGSKATADEFSTDEIEERRYNNKVKKFEDSLFRGRRKLEDQTIQPQSKLSQQPINVAQMNNMAPTGTNQATTNQAPMVSNQNQGIASLTDSSVEGANLARMRAFFPTGIV